MIIGFQKLGLNEKEASCLCQAWGGILHYSWWCSDSVSFSLTFFMFYGSCHCLNKTSVPRLILFSCEFIMLN